MHDHALITAALPLFALAIASLTSDTDINLSSTDASSLFNTSMLPILSLFQSNSSFNWNKDNIDSIDVMNREEASVDERLISVSEVRLAIAKAKSGKAEEPSGVAAD